MSTQTEPSEVSCKPGSASERGPRSIRRGGIVVLVGVVVLLIDQGLNALLPSGPSGPGDVEGFETLVTHPFWVPFKVTQVVGLLLVVLGILTLYHVLILHEKRILTISWAFAAALAASSRVIEFALGGIALPSLVLTFGAGLSQPQLDLLIQGYRALGAGLSIIIGVFTGLAIVLFGTALYRAHFYHPVIGTGGIVLGSYLTLQKVISPGVIDLESLDTPFEILLLIWLLALGVSMIRTTAGTE